ncbi:MAG: hypothetical protein ACOYL6_08090 [Bacteriovoracaceae bacterium]
MKNFVVAKFGGTSVQNISAMKKSAVIANNEKAQLVVVSATSGTTNKLIEIMRIAELGLRKEARLLAQEIISFHHSLAGELIYLSHQLVNLKVSSMKLNPWPKAFLF